MWMVLFVDLCKGCRFIGPFESADDAQAWLDELPFGMRDSADIVDLLSPDQIMEDLKSLERNLQ